MVVNLKKDEAFDCFFKLIVKIRLRYTQLFSGTLVATIYFTVWTLKTNEGILKDK